MSDTHNREKFKKEFCAVAADGECACGNDYKVNCKPAPAWKPADDYDWFIKGQGVRKQAYAPHHVLCVASIATLIIDATDRKVDGVVKATKWCVNVETNMIAMPLWGHTVKWYCNVKDEVIGGGKKTAPSFKNLPQHDWDHTGKGAYIEELEGSLKDLVKEVKMKAHQGKPSNLAKTLDGLSKQYIDKLKTRGADREGGTHEAWKGAASNANWFLPFSMATDASATRKGYPKLQFNKKVLRKLQWLANQIK